MFAYIVRRVINLLPTFLVATFLAWIVVEIAPGDFASQFEFDQVDPNKAERIREVLGLNLPWWQRYFKWLWNIVTQLQLGFSLVSKNEVMDVVGPRMLNSLYLALPATLVIYLIAIPIGVYSAVRQYSIGDRLLTVFSLIGLAIPNFFLALIVLSFAVQWFQQFNCFLIPTGGMTSAELNNLKVCGLKDFDFSAVPWGRAFDFTWHLIAPMLIVALSSLAGITRIMRGQMLEVLGQDYIRTAKSKGLGQGIVTYKHALRNAILVIIATIGSIVPDVLLGAGTVEFVMAWPGLTPLFIKSIFSQDVYVIMAILAIGTALVMVGNIVSDIALALTDPRIRY